MRREEEEKRTFIPARQQPMSEGPAYGIDPNYMMYDPEVSEYSHSTDDEGGTLFNTTGPVSRRPPVRLGVNYPVPTGGTFVRPDLLPPVRNYHIQGGLNMYGPTRRREENGMSGGRFVNPSVLPPIRDTRIQGGKFVDQSVLPPIRTTQIGIDWDNAYHFGSKIGSLNRRED
jgi:hypothetical protein